MQLSNSRRFSSSNSNSDTTEFTVTILNESILLVRLAKELERVLQEIRWAMHELRQDPAAFARSMSLRIFEGIRRQLTLTNLIGSTSAFLVVASLVLLVITFETRLDRQSPEPVVEDGSIERPVFLVLTEAGAGQTSIYRPSIGRVGLSNGRGEGSAPTASRAGGGGSGGMGDLTEAQIGKVPPPSIIPAIIPKEAPTTAPSLPAAGVDLDPLLWTDIKFPVYGDPHSQSPIASNGPGENGGMGNNKGFGVGDGNGNGYGQGNIRNTGGGNPQIGSDGEGGGPAGAGRGREMPFRSFEVEQKVRLLSKPEPHYTEEARRNGTSGTVVLRVVFTSTGQIAQIRAVQTLPFGLTERAIAAARGIKFMPATKGGRPVSVYMQLEYNFNLY